MTAANIWRELGAVLAGEEAAGRGVAHFGRPEAEAARAVAAAPASGEGAVLVPLPGLTLLRLTGADRAPFLHGQLSNTVQDLAPGSCNHTLQLTPKGQVVGEGLLCVRPGELLLTIDDGRGAAVRASLEAHVIFDEVAIEDLSGAWAALTVQGADASATVRRALGRVPAEGTARDGAALPGGLGEARSAGERSDGPLLLPRRRSPAGGVDVVLPVSQLEEAVGALRREGAELAGERALSLMRVLGGVPSAVREGAAGALPQELGLTSAVSFGKGCYLGQEIMARIEARGAVRKGLARLKRAPTGDAPADLSEAALEGRALTVEGREVGRLGTVVTLPQGGTAALAVLRRDLPPDVALRDDAAGAWQPWPLA